jgi:hypothetical protein
LDLHKEYLGLSTDSSLILAEHSGHDIPRDEPKLAIDAILDLVNKARMKSMRVEDSLDIAVGLRWGRATASELYKS